MKLKCKKQTFVTVEYSDLEDFMSKHYGFNIELPYMEEWSNDSSHSFSVTGVDTWTDESERLNAFIQNKGAGDSYMLRTLLNDLCKKGLIEPAEYLVNVSW